MMSEKTTVRSIPRFVEELRGTVVPTHAGRYGPLPSMLVGLTVVTGLVDAFSYLVLGHVFVANMTGNVVFLGFAIAGAPGFSIAPSVVALVAFVLGALAGGMVGTSLAHHRAKLLSATTSLQAVLLAVAVVLAAASGSPVDAEFRYALIVVLAGAMGLQNAVARRLAVPDLTTTVLTLTITGIAADSRVVGGAGSVGGRRLVAVVAMLAGAIAGAVLVLDVHIVGALALALGLTIAVSVAIFLWGRSEHPWLHPA
jgi:uncharacterized membrane protein YoaK (UPF0700 family)